MVPKTESLVTHLAGRVILICVLLMTSACSDDEPVKTAVSGNCAPAEPETPVTRDRQPAPATTQSRKYMMPSRTFEQAPVQQGWGLQSQGVHPAEQQTWGRVQQTFEVPQYAAQQPQRNTTATPWTLPEQSSATGQQFQHEQRPWGPPVEPARGTQPRTAKAPSRQQPNRYQWGAPTGGAYYGWGAQPYGYIPGAGYPGYAW